MPVAIARTPEEVHPTFVAAFNSLDVDAVLALYEPDCVFVTNAGLVYGRESLRDVFQAFFLGKPKITLKTRSIAARDDIALLQADWILEARSPDGQVVSEKGRSGEVVRRQSDGRWLFAIDRPNI